eukprot:7819795-Pyramimonas_sp.AAC.1
MQAALTGIASNVKGLAKKDHESWSEEMAKRVRTLCRRSGPQPSHSGPCNATQLATTATGPFGHPEIHRNHMDAHTANYGYKSKPPQWFVDLGIYEDVEDSGDSDDGTPPQEDEAVKPKRLRCKTPPEDD